MKKRKLLVATVALLFFLGGCSTVKKEDNKFQQQEKKIETLTHEKKQLELLLENEKQKSSVDSLSKIEKEEETESEELEKLIQNFLHAEFERNNEALNDLTTAKLYTMLVDKAGKRDTDIMFKSRVTSLDVYQAKEIDDGTGVIVAKVEVETTVGKNPSSKYQQLVECKAVKSTEGKFQIDEQMLTNLAI